MYRNETPCDTFLESTQNGKSGNWKNSGMMGILNYYFKKEIRKNRPISGI